jgi:hypothetical protein
MRSSGRSLRATRTMPRARCIAVGARRAVAFGCAPGGLATHPPPPPWGRNPAKHCRGSARLRPAVWHGTTRIVALRSSAVPELRPGGSTRAGREGSLPQPRGYPLPPRDSRLRPQGDPFGGATPVAGPWGRSCADSSCPRAARCPPKVSASAPCGRAAGSPVEITLAAVPAQRPARPAEGAAVAERSRFAACVAVQRRGAARTRSRHADSGWNTSHGASMRRPCGRKSPSSSCAFCTRSRWC